MAMETFRINLQSQGLMPIGEATAHRPSGVQQPGSVLVVVDVSRSISPTAVYWALRKVVSKGDHLKILGIITHIPHPLGFMVPVDQSTRNSPNIMELQFEIASKKEAIWRTPYVRDWCEKAGVKLEVDVKAANKPNVIATDEARAMGAFYVILDKNMKKDRKHFVDSLSCVVSRMRSIGGVETLRSFAMTTTNSNKLPPIAPTTPKKTAANTEDSHQSMAPSVASTSSYRGSSMSSTTFELPMAMGEDSSDDLSAHETDPLSISIEASPLPLTVRNNPLCPVLDGDPAVATLNELPPTGRDGDDNKTKNGNKGYSNGNRGYNSNNVLNLNGKNGRFNKNSSSLLHKLPVGRKTGWNEEDIQGHGGLGEIRELQQQLGLSLLSTAKAEFRNEQGQVQRFIRQGPVNGWKMGQLNISLAPEFAGKVSMGRAALTASLQTQASFNNGRRRQYSRPDKVTMDMHWPLMHWADCRAFKLRVQRNASSALMSSSSNSSLSNFRGRPRRVPVGSALNYSDMVDSD